MSSKLNSTVNMSWRNAYHIAGRAVSIISTNGRKDSPVAKFQIEITTARVARAGGARRVFSGSNYVAEIRGDQLTNQLPISRMKPHRTGKLVGEVCITQAIEADVVNLLTGPLAEAKYVAFRDDEVFNANLIYLGALKFYNGTAAMQAVEDYLNSLDYATQERRKKSADLFLTAYSFVNNKLNWDAISSLADYIHQQDQGVISHEEVVSILRYYSTINVADADREFTLATRIQ